MTPYRTSWPAPGSSRNFRAKWARCKSGAKNLWRYRSEISSGWPWRSMTRRYRIRTLLRLLDSAIEERTPANQIEGAHHELERVLGNWTHPDL